MMPNLCPSRSLNDILGATDEGVTSRLLRRFGLDRTVRHTGYGYGTHDTGRSHERDQDRDSRSHEHGARAHGDQGGAW
jgi:hypothetical protein